MPILDVDFINIRNLLAGHVMPTNYDKARTCVELCRFSYKMYAQTLKFPFDPFFEANAKHTDTKLDITRKRMMEYIHEHHLGPNKSDPGSDIRKFDPIEYCLDITPNPSKNVIYREDIIGNKYIVFVPGTWDKKIGSYAGFNLVGTQLMPTPPPIASGGTSRCGYFQGRTGMTVNHPNSGWISFLGAVIYDPATRTAYVVFRGSRSGNAERAALGAQFHSKGNPDWVTDMNHLKESVPFNPGFGPQDISLAAGFWKSYVSSNRSMEAAFNFAVGGNVVDTVCVTGHSLGGGLAQCAYIHLCVSPRIKQRLHLTNTAVIECYPISAPPVCLGLVTQHWVSREANASNVHHYYCPYDAVHACNLVLSGFETRLSKVTGTAHPRTSTYHFGSQLALNSNAKFPLAHEPSIVWKALWLDDVVPKGFWQMIELDELNHNVTSSSIEDPNDIHQQVEAIYQSFNVQAFIDRAQSWANGITGHGVINRGNNKNMAQACINEVSAVFSDLNFTPQEQARVLTLLRNSIANNTSDTAGCVYYTLRIWVSIQIWLLRNRGYIPVQPRVVENPFGPYARRNGLMGRNGERDY